MDKIEQRIEGVFSKKKNIIKMQDKLMTEQYLDSVCEEINEELQQQMQLNLSEITHKYNFPIDFVRRML